MSDLATSLERLAERGSPRGATTVFRSARPDRLRARQHSGPGVGFLFAVLAFVIVGTAVLLGSDSQGDVASGVDAGPGTITIVLDGWEGLEGYEVLAVVFRSEIDTDEGPLVGAGVYTIIDSDPFGTVDVVHPARLGSDDEDTTWPDWATDDYLWDETAVLDPGQYVVQVVANPGRLAPFGSHLPAAGAERRCETIVAVTAESGVVVEFSTPLIDDPWNDAEACARVLTGDGS